MSAMAIVAKQLAVQRQGRSILHGLDFSIRQGSITGLLGPSGAGKTTLIRAIMGLQVVQGGSIRVLEYLAGDARLRSQIGYVTQSPSVYADLTVQQNLRYFASLLGKDESAVSAVIQQVGLQDQAKQLVGDLSGGQQTRVSLGAALVGDASLLVLDEPTVGLDPVLRRQLWRVFHDIADQGRTILVSSHAMDEAEQCDDVLLLRDGALLRQGSPRDLLHVTHTKTMDDAFIALVGTPNA